MTKHVGGNLESGVQPAQAWSTGQQLAGYAEHVYTAEDDPPVETNSIRAWRDWAGLRNGQLALRLDNHRAPRVHSLGWGLDPENVWRPLRVDADGALLVNTGPVPPPPEPTPPTAQLSAWYRASDLNQPDGSAVVAWPDLSGNGATLLQTAGLGPGQYVLAGIGGQPSVYWDGFSQLNRGTPPGFVAGDTAFSIYIVALPDFTIPGSQFCMFGWGNSANTDGQVLFRWRNSGTGWGVEIDSQGGGSNRYEATLTAQILSASNLHATAVSSTEIRIDGAIPSTVLSAGFGGPLAIVAPVFDARLGIPNNSGDRFRGQLSEILVYHKHHNASERAQTLAYLSARYGIPVAP